MYRILLDHHVHALLYLAINVHARSCHVIKFVMFDGVGLHI